MRKTLVLLALAAATLGAPSSANAAPMEQSCAAGAFRQADMAGTYLSPEHAMRLEIFPCGGSALQWDNAWGTHVAVYGSKARLTGGGVAALASPNYERLDGTSTIGFKPAEPGWIEVWTVGPYGDLIGVYRLKKIV